MGFSEMMVSILKKRGICNMGFKSLLAPLSGGHKLHGFQMGDGPPKLRG
jgi:hypothetical protein